MTLKQKYYGQQDGSTVPDVTLTGNPGTDQITLTNALYLGGIIMAMKTSSTSGRGAVIVPSDPATAAIANVVGFLLNGPGEFAGSIGPSGSGKAPILRGLPQFYVDSQAYVASPSPAYTVGCLLYCGTTSNAGLFTTVQTGTASPVGICMQIPTATDPLLGVISLI